VNIFKCGVQNVGRTEVKKKIVAEDKLEKKEKKDMFSREEALRMAAQESNAEVLEPKQAPPKGDVLPATQVRQLFDNLHAAYVSTQTHRSEHTDEEHRQHLKRLPSFRAFSKSHPSFFVVATSQETTKESLKMVHMMLSLRESHENSLKTSHEQTKEALQFMKKHVFKTS
tara:strand:+ start:2132 stop:2641 length:510 start_codon:yes stop_codon:yes gene_type:complete